MSASVSNPVHWSTTVTGDSAVVLAAAQAGMAGFYVFNNAGIGLKCFAGGIVFGIGSLVVLAFNGLTLGTVFGHMLASPVADHFGEFVTAHGLPLRSRRCRSTPWRHATPRAQAAAFPG